MARFNNGWVRIQRKALLGDINSNYTRGGLFGALVAMANIQGSIVSWKGQPRKLERGEIVTSFQELANLGGVDRKTVVKHLNYLVARETIILEKCAQGILIKFPNYDKYHALNAEWSHEGPADMDNGMDNAMDNGVPHIEQRNNITRKQGKNIYAFDFEKFLEVLKPVIKVVGSNAGSRFKAQITTQEKYDELLKAASNYVTMLSVEEWRRPKTSVANFLGTERSGYFWRDFINLDLSKLKKKKYENEREIDHDAEMNEIWGFKP